MCTTPKSKVKWKLRKVNVKVKVYNWLIWKVDFREERESKLIWIISATSLVFTLFSVAWRRSPTRTSVAFARETSSSTSTAGSSLSWTNLRCISCNMSYFLSKLMLFSLPGCREPIPSWSEHCDPGNLEGIRPAARHHCICSGPDPLRVRPLFLLPSYLPHFWWGSIWSNYLREINPNLHL